MLARFRHLLSFALMIVPPVLVDGGASVAAHASGWSRDFGSHAFDLDVRELLVDGDELVAVGSFTQTPNGLASGVAAWDGVAWRAMGEGLPGIVSAVVVHDGARIAGGAFAVAGRHDYDHVARWDGVRWVPLPTPGGQVRDLAVVAGTLYAAGTFPLGGGRHAPAVRWTGSAWEGLGSVSELVPLSPVALAEYGGRLVLGGRFPVTNETEFALVLAWTGTEWDTLARGVGFVRALAVHDGELHAGGSFVRSIHGASSPVIAWNGARWRSALPSEWSGSVEHLRSDTDGLVVAGSLAQGTEARRHRVMYVHAEFGVFATPSLVGEVLSTATYGHRLHVAGELVGAQTSATDTAFVFGVLRVGHPAWEVVGGAPRAGRGFGRGSFDRIAALLAHDGALFAGGSFVAVRDGASWEPAAPVMRWDGSDWEALGIGQMGGGVEALAWWDGALVAGGRFESGPGAVEVFENLARWNGERWLPVAPPLGGTVHTLAAREGELFVAGRLDYGHAQSAVARWDGVAWSTLGPPSTGIFEIRALLDHPSGLVAGGTFTEIGGVAASHVARWNGASWEPLGPGLPGGVTALASYRGQIVAAGSFGTHDLRVWDGATWRPLGSGPIEGVYALEAVGSQLYVAGSFPYAGGLATYGIARWNGAAWSALGSGLGPAASSLSAGAAFALEPFQAGLYVGGAFASAGGASSTLIARWEELRFSPGTAQLELGTPWPAPFADQVRLTLTARVAQRIEVRVLDLAGRSVRVLAAGDFDPGEHVLAWDGRDGDGRALASGIFYVSATGHGGREGRRVLLVR